MALSANTVFEVRPGGSDTNGGGFVTGASGTDWSQQDSPQYSVTDGVTAGSTTITSASASFGADVVGNLIYVQGGTGSVAENWYQITARASATSITVDRSTGLTAGTGVTLKIGGALASPGRAGLAAQGIAGTIVYIKYDASPYLITTASSNVSGGCPLGQSSQYWIGYDSVRSPYQLGFNRPTLKLDAGVSSATIFLGTNNTSYIQGLILDANNQASSRCGFNSGEWFNVKAMGATATGSATVGSAISENSSGGRMILCEVTGCSGTYGLNALTALNCWVHDNTLVSGGAGCIAPRAVGCLSFNNTGTNNDGFISPFTMNCVAYGNARHGFNFGNNASDAVNCVAEDNGGYAFVQNTNNGMRFNCAAYNNTSGRSSLGSGRVYDIDAITGSGSFFTNAATADFTPNNTAGAGALLRAAGFPASFMGLDNYGDVGAFQHQDAGGGGGGGLLVNPGMRGGMI